MWICASFYPSKIQKQTHSNANQCDTVEYPSVIFQEEQKQETEELSLKRLD